MIPCTPLQVNGDNLEYNAGTVFFFKEIFHLSWVLHAAWLSFHRFQTTSLLWFPSMALTQFFPVLQMLDSLLFLFTLRGWPYIPLWEDEFYHASSTNCLSWYLQTYLLPYNFSPSFLSQRKRNSFFWWRVVSLSVFQSCPPPVPCKPCSASHPFVVLSSITTSVMRALSLQYINVTDPTLPESCSLISFFS